ncbi:helix-turn-helix domain-containing protein [Hespellia stercorisuis]|jgi:transcriptional regulator with XRE-family HTH domain|uniref:Transcriptional regulator, contains XRE-family HTH domain n=1 Tax=Hespellia stercorisuis DSM 15480 TaxID=1121950 RepID=A0A1M6PQG2_9FIRM|nr:helix-turn-helix transcriptional regulator [Hespellia stercorisuis]SHK10214.1 Transcriptional regulator, contains XRE-family HTH domain [Hespellia stercorisuis DSM 15480]
MTFGEKLRTLRLKANMKQKELAEKAGLGLNTISNYEKGKTYPQNREVYTILANILGVSADELRNENDDFIISARERYGYTGKKQAQKLVEEMGGLFAGGELSDEDLDGVMKAFQDYYWKAKEDNKKYTPKKYKTE